MTVFGRVSRAQAEKGSGVMKDEELEALRHEMQSQLDYSGYIDDKSEDEYAREGARTAIGLIDEMKRRVQSAAHEERERILRWLRVVYQWNAPYRAIADAIERGEYNRPYFPPPGLVDDRPAMTADEYDEKRRSETCCQCGSIGVVRNRHANSEQPPMAITWRCAGCKRPVCINCTLTIPNSVPVEFYETTWCSEVCRGRSGS